MDGNVRCCFVDRSYESHILPQSDRKPYLIYAYADFCFQCMQMEVMWERIVADLQELGKRFTVILQLHSL